MTIEELRNYCLSKPGASESFPFDDNVLVFKVMNKMFALTSLKKWEAGEHSINLKCDPKKAIKLREKYPEFVFPGFHMHKKHWNTVVIENSDLIETFIKHLINYSYELVVSKLSKKDKAKLDSFMHRR
ncbi:MmcQ/YjbR family DNA-binding protein [Flavobacteriaceae bacterium 14752]|uniref:MmcQ/YjbR family DNA-binding protein n=1 Tax=Mesohalobacter salilacus TaxID=2491711 RepID=UPI000F640C81|nr:MmcQ/YjbR family DNA-binding protein [Flavobacteriaceae bacterium 14752]